MITLKELNEKKFNKIKNLINTKIDATKLTGEEWALLHDFLCCIKSEIVNKLVETTNEQPKKCKYCPKNNIELCCKYRED